jgi:hypothetical protein
VKPKHRQLNSFDFMKNPEFKPLSKSPKVRKRANGQRVPPPETPIAVGQIPGDPLLTTRQAAAILSDSPETLKKWRQRPGKGPEFIKYPSGAIRYRLSTIMQFLASCTVSRNRHPPFNLVRR